MNDLNALHLGEQHEPGNRHAIASTRWRFRMPDQRSRTSSICPRNASDAGSLRGDTRETVVCEQLPAAQPTGRARHKVRAAVSPDWDHHGNPGTELGKSLDDRCKEVDQASAALITDLKQRGLLDEQSSSGAENSAALPKVNHGTSSAGIITLKRSPCGWPVAASSPA